MTLATPIDYKILQTLKKYIPSVKVYLVGGAVRDSFINKKSKDRDYLIENASFEQIASALSNIGTVNEIGKSFGIVQAVIDGESYDFSLPRTEVSTGEYHTDFEIKTDGVTLLDDLSRRDFSMNAIAFEIETGLMIDPYNGIEDIKNKQITFVGKAMDRFNEDPLRLIRMIQFAHRFKFKMDPDGIRVFMKNKDYVIKRLEFIPPERIWEELKKMFLKSSPMKYSSDFTYITMELFFKPYFGIKEIINICGHCSSEEEQITTYLISIFLMGGDYKKLKLPNLYNDIMAITHDLFTFKRFIPNQFKNKEKLKIIINSMRNLHDDVDSEFINDLISLADKIYKTPINIKEFCISGNDFIDAGVNPKDIGIMVNYMSDMIFKKQLTNTRDCLLSIINNFKAE
jgi:hypothetical protein